MKKYTTEDIKQVGSGLEFEKLQNSIDISFEGFRNNLISAVNLAHDFTQQYVLEVLPDELSYLVRLGGSYDGNPLRDDETTYPKDYEDSERSYSSVDDIAKLLWRSGKVPEWVNVQVLKQDKTYTYINLICCGRFSNNKSNIYHAHEGKAPFHVLGPALPIEYSAGEKFSLYWQENA